MGTWAVTTASNPLEFDTSYSLSSSCYQIDSNHFINFWAGSGNDGYVQTFEVDTSTWAVTTANSPLEFDTVNGAHNSCYQIDSNHFINFWSGDSSDGFVQVFEVNTSTWAVTTANSPLEFDTVNGVYNSCYQIDSNHFINFWAGSGDGFVQVFEVDTSTWAVTTASNSLEFDTNAGFNTSAGQSNICRSIDSNHFINFWSKWTSSDTAEQLVQIFEVNTTTWAVTTAGGSLTFNDTPLGENGSCTQIDSSHFLHFLSLFHNTGRAQTFQIDTSTWTVTTTGTSAEYDATFAYNPTSSFPIDEKHFLNFHTDRVTSYAIAQVYKVEEQYTGAKESLLSIKGLEIAFNLHGLGIKGLATGDMQSYLSILGGLATSHITPLSIKGQDVSSIASLLSIKGLTAGDIGGLLSILGGLNIANDLNIGIKGLLRGDIRSLLSVSGYDTIDTYSLVSIKGQETNNDFIQICIRGSDGNLVEDLPTRVRLEEGN